MAKAGFAQLPRRPHADTELTMAIRFSLPLQASPEQLQRLLQLQETFALACNSLIPLVRETRCWNRVGLHQMAYRQLREKFPQLGSQMACNAIYSVSRACRLVYQSQGSPWLATRQPDTPLPLIAFGNQAPVFFDRHTLSLREGGVSMFTLDGRMRFQVELSASHQAHFVNDRLREVVLQRIGSIFHLSFVFTPVDGDLLPDSHDGHLPEYLLVQQAASEPAQTNSTPSGGIANARLTGVA